MSEIFQSIELFNKEIGVQWNEGSDLLSMMIWRIVMASPDELQSLARSLFEEPVARLPEPVKAMIARMAAGEKPSKWNLDCFLMFCEPGEADEIRAFFKSRL